MHKMFMVGINFADKQEAEHFSKVVELKIAGKGSWVWLNQMSSGLCMYCARARSTLIHTDIRMRMEHKQKLVAAIQRQSKPAASKQAGSAVKANTPRRQVVRRSISQLTEPKTSEYMGTRHVIYCSSVQHLSYLLLCSPSHANNVLTHTIAIETKPPEAEYQNILQTIGGSIRRRGKGLHHLRLHALRIVHGLQRQPL